MKDKNKKLFWVQVIIFVLLVSFFAIPFSDQLRRKLFIVAGVLAAIFLILGVVQVFIARKEKGKRKLFLTIMGASAAVFLLSTVLHNFMYALAILTEKIVVLNYFFEFLHAAFFLIGLIGCPIAFIVGAVGYLLNKK